VSQAGIAQLVEHLICNQGVGGSSPSAGTNTLEKSSQFERQPEVSRNQQTGVSTMADRELIAAIILAGLLARNTGASADELAPSAIEAADKLRAALEGSPKLSGPVGFTSQNDDEPPPGTP